MMQTFEPKRVPPKKLHELEQERVRVAQTLEEANKANSALHEIVQSQLALLQSLAACRHSQDILALLPRIGDLQRQQEATGETEVSQIIADVERLLAKVHEMQEQRKFLEQKLREEVSKDDISPILLEKKHLNPQVSLVFFLPLTSHMHSLFQMC